MGNPVVHFEIMTKDAAALRDFYAKVFDWRSKPAEGASGVDYGIIENGAGVGGGIGEAPAGYDGHVTFYVGVPDVAAMLERIEEQGGTRMMGPDQVPGGPLIALFRDPHNHTIGLVQTP